MKGQVRSHRLKNMKVSKVLHITGVIVGFAGIITALVGVYAGDGRVWGLTKEHILFCSGLLMLIAIWLAVSTVHHLMLEDRGKAI